MSGLSAVLVFAMLGAFVYCAVKESSVTGTYKLLHAQFLSAKAMYDGILREMDE